MYSLPRTATLTDATGQPLLTFTNRLDPNATVEAILGNIEGFYGGVGVEADATQRALGHGLFTQRAYRTGRQLTLTGSIHFTDEADRALVDRLISGVLGDGEHGRLWVDVDGVQLWSQVRLDGEVKHSFIGQRAISVQIPLIAEDPFLYGEEQVLQVYPEGAGVGLRFPLLGQTGRPTGEASPLAWETRYEPTQGMTGPDGQEVYAYASTLPGGKVWKLEGLVPGGSYRQRIWVKADRPGSRFAVRTNRFARTGEKSTSIADYYIPAQDTPIEWTLFENLFGVPQDSTGTGGLYVWLNHPTGQVTDSETLIAVEVTRIDPGLHYGTSDRPTLAVVHNRGNAESWPMIRVRGDSPGGFTLTADTGETIRFPHAVWQQTPVEIDMAAGALYVAGMDHTYMATRREWSSIPPGGTKSWRIASHLPGDGWAEIVHHDTYI